MNNNFDNPPAFATLGLMSDASGNLNAITRQQDQEAVKTDADFKLKRIKNTPNGFARFSAACPTCNKRVFLRRWPTWDKDAGWDANHEFYHCKITTDWKESELIKKFEGVAAGNDAVHDEWVHAVNEQARIVDEKTKDLADMGVHPSAWTELTKPEMDKFKQIAGSCPPIESKADHPLTDAEDKLEFWRGFGEVLLRHWQSMPFTIGNEGKLKERLEWLLAEKVLPIERQRSE